MKNDLDMKSDTENEEDGTMSTESADVRPAESTDARPAGAQQPTHHHSQPSHHHGHALAGILGPAFVAAVAYVDPGNVAANITSGARYGYLLVWVLVLANCMSVLIQYQSAKLGIVTGKSLPEILGERLGDAGRFMFFMQAEVIAIATDLAEVIGGAIALKLLFGLPLFVGGCIIGAVSTVLLIFEKGATHRIFEKLIIGLLLVITFGFIAGLFIAPPNPKEVVAGLIPRFKGTDTVLMATSMLGATVMPHAIYLHSTLVNDHYAPGEAKPSIKKLLHGSKIDVAWALILAGSVNLALLILAANSLYGMTGTDTIEGAHRAGDRHDFLDWSACVEPELHVGRHLRRQRNHARPATHQSADVGVPSGDAGTRAGGAMVRQQSDGSVDRRPGRAVGRHSICDYSADALHARPHADGGVCGRSGQARRQYRGRRADRRSERGADCADNARQSLIFRDFYVDLRRICGAFFVVSQLIF